jgi:hypothetical protein
MEIPLSFFGEEGQRKLDIYYRSGEVDRRLFGEPNCVRDADDFFEEVKDDPEVVQICYMRMERGLLLVVPVQIRNADGSWIDESMKSSR